MYTTHARTLRAPRIRDWPRRTKCRPKPVCPLRRGQSREISSATNKSCFTGRHLFDGSAAVVVAACRVPPKKQAPPFSLNVITCGCTQRLGQERLAASHNERVASARQSRHSRVGHFCGLSRWSLPCLPVGAGRGATHDDVVRWSWLVRGISRSASATTRATPPGFLFRARQTFTRKEKSGVSRPPSLLFSPALSALFLPVVPRLARTKKSKVREVLCSLDEQKEADPLERFVVRICLRGPYNIVM